MHYASERLHMLQTESSETQKLMESNALLERERQNTHEFYLQYRMEINIQKHTAHQHCRLSFTHRLFRRPQEVESAALVHQSV